MTAGEAKYQARLKLIEFAREQATASEDPETRDAFNCLADEVEEAPTSYEELAACIRATRPDVAHTVDWDVHPDDYNDECFCYDCMTIDY